MTAEHLAAVFRCPLCAGRLSLREGRTLKCPSGHAFDVAREGYVNLTLAQAKRSKDPGYNIQLMRSRHAFFGTGSYEPAARAIADLLFAAVPTNGHVLDAGCGEGYYLRVLRERAPRLDIIGTDLSRSGMRVAARLDPAGAYAVANSYHLPMDANSLDGVVSHFSPNPVGAFARVLRPGGTMLIGSPGADHLFSMKAAVYDSPRRHDEENHRVVDARFVQTGRRVVRYPLLIDDVTALEALFSMTPYAYGANNAARLLDTEASTFITEVHMLLDTYRYNP